jgi:lycopene beta-cyclase
MMQTFDFIIAGGGLAGLSLACKIAHSTLRERSMLIIDQDEKQGEDRTFSYWSNEPDLFEPAVSQVWDYLSFHGVGYYRTLPLENYQYRTIKGIDFYRYARTELEALPNVKFLQGRISIIQDEPDGVIVKVDDQEHRGRWAFDSRGQPGGLIQNHDRYTYLKLAFRGWLVEASRDAFDPQAATLMDFRTQQKDGVSFFYVLPFSERCALVEYTKFTTKPLKVEACQKAIHSYLKAAYNLEIGKECKVIPSEGGRLLVTDHSCSRQIGRNILAIGLQGGRLKPSTGFAYTRIQRDSEAIVLSLQKNGCPFDLPQSSPLYGLLDSIMLEVMEKHPHLIPGIFSALFKKNPIQCVFRFLDEEASVLEIIRLVAGLPPGVFLKILARRIFTPLRFLLPSKLLRL